MTRPNQRHVVMMCKAPRMGRVKSRLARGIGWIGAWNFYRRNLFSTTNVLGNGNWLCWLCVSPDTARADGRQWPKFWHRVAQGGGDLGARMYRCFQTFPPGPLVMIGSDIPDIAPKDIKAAFEMLKTNDFVFGASPDGGYWLVGAKRSPRVMNPFSGVRWSTRHALNDTLNNIPKGVRVGFVKERSDVDTKDDL